MNGVLEKLKDGVLGVIFPMTCVGCGREGRYVCAECEIFFGEAGFVCPFCQQASFGGERHSACAPRYGLDGLVSMWEYEGVVQRLIHLVKYGGVTHAAKEITERSFGRMTAEGSRFEAFLSFLHSPVTQVAYVPSHKKKEKRRGFNQAAIFAETLSRYAGRPCISLLCKTKETTPQIDLHKEDRLHNVQGSFICLADSWAGNIEKVVLVDDVWTTGATMKECCKTLKKAGVREVWGFTVARTP